jgi:GH25 family lysozyme M1 (1,4-beta-N-acetylmuramidase)
MPHPNPGAHPVPAPPRRSLPVLLRGLLVAALLLVAGTAAATVPAAPAHANGHIWGIDVASYQGNVDWNAVAAHGASFAYVKATEGMTYRNPYFGQQYTGSYYAGLVRGAYHFALPNVSGGREQAQFLLQNGGAWSADNQTLPAALDIEYNPYGATCYGLSQGQMVQWIYDFVNEYWSWTGRDPVIYTTADWWNRCTGYNTMFAQWDPLWVAHYGVSSPTLPAGWSFHTFWQYTSCEYVWGVNGCVDGNTFNGEYNQLVAIANGYW